MDFLRNETLLRIPTPNFCSRSSKYRTFVERIIRLKIDKIVLYLYDPLCMLTSAQQIVFSLVLFTLIEHEVMKYTSLLGRSFVALLFTTTLGGSVTAQALSGFRTEAAPEISFVTDRSTFHGYTNHWHDDYTRSFRYGNLFKISIPDLESTLLQTKIDVAKDLGLPGLLMQEGFVSNLLGGSYQTVENPSTAELEQALKKGNTLVITSPSTDLGRQLEEQGAPLFAWAQTLGSHQFKTAGLEPIRAFYLTNGGTKLFVISSASADQIAQFRQLIASTKEVVDRYTMHKGWFGAESLLKSVTITPGHPLEMIGMGMNEGNSWFIFDGYMDFLGQAEYRGWMKEINLPVLVDVGFSPIYGCANYDGLQVQDMPTRQSWVDFARKKGGHLFRPVYAPELDGFEFDGFITDPGNKEQIDNENTPFIHRSGTLSGHLSSSMILFIEKGKALTNETLWDAILSRREVAIGENALLMGPATYRHTVGLLYLDKQYLESYYNDRIDLRAETDRYNLIVTLKNYESTAVTGRIELQTSDALSAQNLPGEVTLQPNEVKQFSIPVQPNQRAMGKTNPIGVKFTSGGKTKQTLAMLDLPPAISAYQLMYGHTPTVSYPVTIHNFSKESSFPVEVSLFRKGNLQKALYTQTLTYQTAPATFQEQLFTLKVSSAGDYIVRTKALGVTTETQLGVGKAEGKPYLYEMDLNGDGVNEYRMENKHVQVTLLRTGARVIEYIIKSRDENIFFKGWPEKTFNHRAPYRMRGFYPYGGFEDFLGQGSMETHRVYDARVIQKEGDYVQVEMTADYYGNTIKKIFTLYGDSPLLEVKFALVFNEKDANLLGPQPVLELGAKHGTEDVFFAPTMDGLKEYRMRPEEYYGQAIQIAEGWNAGYDTQEDISFVGAFPVEQPLFLHMWMNHPRNPEAPHYYAEFQPWTPIIQKSTMYFSYYIWGDSGSWENGLDALKQRNLITVRPTAEK